MQDPTANAKFLSNNNVAFMQDDARIDRYMETINGGLPPCDQLTREEVIVDMNKGLAALQDESWAAVHGINENFEAFVKAEVLAEDPGTYTDNCGDTYEVFEPGESRSDSEAGLRDLFDASSKDEAVQEYIENIAIEMTLEEYRQDMIEGLRAGQAQAEADGSLGGDLAMMAKGLIATPEYLFESVTSDEVGFLDDEQMAAYNSALLGLQGKPEEVGFINGYSDTIENRLASLGLATSAAGMLTKEAVSGYRVGVPDVGVAGNKGPIQLEFRDAVQLDEFTRLNQVDVAVGKLKPGEASAAVEIQSAFGGTVRRANTADGEVDFVFIDGVNQGKTVDFMFTVDNKKQQTYLNKFFNNNFDRNAEQLNSHLQKADLIPLDFRNLDVQNQAQLMDVINNMSVEQSSKLLIMK